MKRIQRKMIKESIKTKIGDKLPGFKGIFIIPRKKLHESGYRMMYVIGHTEYDRTKKDCEYYLLGTFSDVIDIQPIFEKYIKNKYDMCDLHMDINKQGTIHIWTNSKKKAIRCKCQHLSNCTFEVEDEI